MNLNNQDKPKNKDHQSDGDEALYRAIFETSSAAIAIIDADTTILMVNEAYCEISGYTKDEVIGMSWIQQIPPDDLERLKENNKRRITNPNDAPKKYESTFYKKNGEIRHGMISISMLQPGKKMIISLLDITERKQAEEALRISEARYRSFIEYANDIVYAISIEGIFTYASPNWTEKLGHEQHEIIGHSYAEFIHPDDVIRLSKLIKQNYDTGAKLSGIEYQIRHKNGTWKWYASSSSPIIDANGQVTSIIGIAHNITQRKQAEEARLKSEALLNTLVQTIPDLIWLKDPDGVYLSCNTMFERFFGATNAEISGKTDYDFVDRQLADSFRKNDQIAIRKGGASNNEEWVTFANDGHRALLDTLKTPMYAPDGKLIGVLGVARDITARKQIEEALKESEFFFKESQRAAFIGSYKADFITGYWESSEVLDQIFGIDENYIRSVDEGWLNMIHPDDRDRMNQYLIEEVITKQKSFNTEYRIIRKSDNATRWVHGLGEIILNAERKPVSLIGTIQDITVRKQHEATIHENQAKLSLALKIAHLGPWEYDVASDQFTFNDSFYAIFHTNSKEMGGYKMSSSEYTKRFVHPDERMLIQQAIVTSIETSDPEYVLQVEHRIIYADGNEGYIVVRSAVIKNNQGKTIKTYGINQDITERKHIEEELRKSETQLRELNATKDKFFSIIAHDLRTPFSSLLGLSEIMASENSRLSISQFIHFSQVLNKAADSAFQLLENLLEWSRLQRGAIPFNPEVILAKEFVSSVNEWAFEMARKKTIQLHFNYQPEMTLYADANMLHSIVRNLITNAIKFTPNSGQIEVTIKNENNNTTLLSVKDTGIGISKELIDKLFQIDTNVSRPGTNNESSSGLGLIICKEFVEKHGGKIWIESQENQGSTIYFTIRTE